MDDVIIDNTNAVVGEDDVLYHNGDFAFGRDATHQRIVEVRNRIRCKNIYLIFGNHDKEIKKKEFLRNLFVSIDQWRLEKFEIGKLLLVHRPPVEGSWEARLIKTQLKIDPTTQWVHGHTHNNKFPFGNRNISIEATEYKPLSLEELFERLDQANGEQKEGAESESEAVVETSSEILET